MDEKLKQKLIIITGSPCVGKTTVATHIFDDGLLFHNNVAYLDDDTVWNVKGEPRNKGGHRRNFTVVVSTYLDNFDYVIFSSARMVDKSNRKNLFKNITANHYDTIGFHLTCSEETLVERHKNRGDAHDISFDWLRREPYPGDFVINTDDKPAEHVANEIKMIIQTNIH